MDLKKLKLTKQMNIGIYVAVTALFALYYLGFYSKSRAVVVQLNRTIASETVELEKSRAQYSDLSNRRPAAVDADDSLTIYDKYAQTNASLASVIGTLAKGDGKSPFSLNKIVSEKQEIVNGYTKTQFSINLDASFPAIGGLLEGLEQSPLLTDVQTVEISRMGNELKKCSAKIKLLSYVVRK